MGIGPGGGGDIAFAGLGIWVNYYTDESVTTSGVRVFVCKLAAQ